jgi:HK97 gp10 family phage protein
MASDISIELDMDRLLGLPAEVEANASAILSAHALLVETVAKQKAPVETEFLRESIQANTSEPLRKVVNVGAEYGIYQEFGTTRMSAQPYFVPAVEFVRPKLVKAWEGLIPK